MTTHPRIYPRCATFLAFEVQMRRERETLVLLLFFFTLAALRVILFDVRDLQRQISWQRERYTLINSPLHIFWGLVSVGAAVEFPWQSMNEGCAGVWFMISVRVSQFCSHLLIYTLAIHSVKRRGESSLSTAWFIGIQMTYNLVGNKSEHFNGPRMPNKSI